MKYGREATRIGKGLRMAEACFRRTCVWACLSVFFSLTFCAWGGQDTPQGRTFYVNSETDEPKFDGTREYPFQTIRAALDHAQPGDTVCVSGGVYHEKVMLPEAVTLKGEASEEEKKPRISGSVRGANNATLENLIVAPPSAEVVRGIYGVSLDDFRVRNVTVRDLTENGRGAGYVVGMDFWKCTRLFIKDCKVLNLSEKQWGSACGIRLIDCQVRLGDTAIRAIHEEDWGSAYGLLLIRCSGEIARNIVSDIHETAWHDAYGIKLVGCAELTVRNNTLDGICGSDWDDVYGLFADLDTQAVIENNIASNVDRGSAWSDLYSTAGIYNGSNETVVRFNNVWKATRDYAGPHKKSNLNVNPGFADKAMFQLRKDSPCRAAGNPATKNRDKSPSDIGATGGAEIEAFPDLPNTESAFDTKTKEWVAKLHADDFQTREQAFTELRKIGKAALPVLRDGMDGRDAEGATRCRSLVSELTRPSPLVQRILESDKTGAWRLADVKTATSEELRFLLYALDGHGYALLEGLAATQRIPELIEALKIDYLDRHQVGKALQACLPRETLEALGADGLERDALANRERTEEVIRKIRRGSSSQKPAVQNLASLWDALGAEDAASARKAVWALVAEREKAVALIKENMRAGTEERPSAEALQLIAELDDDDFSARESATKKLRALGAEAAPALRKTLAGNPSAEARKRVAALLKELPPLPVVTDDPETLRAIRAIQVLEEIRTAESQEVLETLAKGPSEARPTQEARAAVERLKGRVEKERPAAREPADGQRKDTETPRKKPAIVDDK